MFRPFGNSNHEFIFCSKNVEILEQRILGKKKNALKFKFRQNNVILDGICFNATMNDYLRRFETGEKYINIAYNISKNSFAGKTNIQLMLCNFAKTTTLIQKG
jgi:single-stranded DNA-specific DHH superfamily exonuclease